MNDVKIKFVVCKDGGLILQRKHIIQDSPRAKKENVGKWTKWKDHKFPTLKGAGMCAVRELFPDTDIGEMENGEDIIAAIDHLSDIIENIGLNVADSIRERGVV